MAKISASLKLTDSEINELLRLENRLRIATLGPGPEINLTPMTFGWAGGAIYIFGRGQKIANLRRNPTATVLVDTGSKWRELQGVMLHGRARVLETIEDERDDPYLSEAQLDLGRKHGLTKEGAVQPYKATASGKSRRWIVFRASKVVSWDNSKLPGGEE